MTKSVQSGRSMIEMLGVLAIIGVLSVGGIAGYSKAMMKYKINKAVEQITLIAGNVRTFFAPQRNYEGINDNTILRKAKLIPEEMWNTNNTGFASVFGYGVQLNTASKSIQGDKQAFTISYGIPFDEGVCIEFLSQDWTDAGIRGVIASGPYRILVTAPVSVDRAVSECSSFVSRIKSMNLAGGSIIFELYLDVANIRCFTSSC